MRIRPRPRPATATSVRAYFEANGKFQLDPVWSITSSLRVATDKTVTRRYDITNDDRLRNVVNAERISPNSYITIAGWAFKGLRVDDVQKQIPIALPAIDARFRRGRRRSAAGSSFRPTACRSCASTARIRSAPSPAPAGTCAVSRRWGQELALTAYARGDVYHTDDAAEHDGADLPGRPMAGMRAASARSPQTSMAVGRAGCWAASSGCCRASSWC